MRGHRPRYGLQVTSYALRKVLHSALRRVINFFHFFTKEFISKAPSPSPSPSRGEGCNTSPPLRGGDEGEGDVCGFTNDRISNSKLVTRNDGCAG
jgi:hypothetical protein